MGEGLGTLPEDLYLEHNDLAESLPRDRSRDLMRVIETPRVKPELQGEYSSLVSGYEKYRQALADLFPLSDGLLYDSELLASTITIETADGRTIKPRMKNSPWSVEAAIQDVNSFFIMRIIAIEQESGTPKGDGYFDQESQKIKEREKIAKSMEGNIDLSDAHKVKHLDKYIDQAKAEAEADGKTIDLGNKPVE